MRRATRFVESLTPLSATSYSTLVGPIVIALSAVICTSCGTGDGLDRKAISGMVTVDGKPIPDGSINFEPLGGSGVGGGAVIANGAFALSVAEGLPPGKYRVTITGNDASQSSVSPGKMPGDEEFVPPKALVPPEWNEEKHEVDVAAGAGPIQFNFEIKSKK